MANSSLIKSLENIMRIDDGVDGDSQYIGQITWMLFLKAFDAKEMEWEFKPGYKGIIPAGYRWRDWADNKEGITGDALIKFVGELFETLRKLDVSDGDMRKYVVRNVFEDINNYMKSGVQLRKLINAINDKVDFNDARERHTFNELYEEMLRDLQSAGQAGEFYTPRPVTNFIVEKVDPKLGEIVLDPACGTGGFLTSTIAHFGSIQSTEELAMLQKSINGWEKKPLPFLLAMTNLILHDIEIPALRHQNSLSKPLSEYSAKDRVDVIVANPPFGGAEDKSVKNNFPSEFQTSETADLFMALIMHLLKDKGRCGIVLPKGFMFGSGVKRNLKEKLLKEYGLHTIIRLPQVFKPYADEYTNLLFFQKGVASRGVWFYRLDYPEGVKSFTKTKPMKDEHFSPVREWWDDKQPITVDGKDKARFFTVDELVELNYDFDKCCPYVQEEEEILEPAELIASYQSERLALNKELDVIIESINDKLACKDNAKIVFSQKNIIERLLKINSEFSSKLRKSILQQAIQGKLTERNFSDEPASELLKRICAVKTDLIAKDKIKKEKSHSIITDEEKPFDIPPTWEWATLIDITYQVGNKENQILANEVKETGTFPAVSQGKNLIDGYCDCKEKVIYDLPLVMFGDHTRNVKYIDFPFVISADGTKLFKPILLNEKYLYYWMMLTAELLRNRGYARHFTLLKQQLVPIPPIEEQARIVARVEELLAACDGLK